jgi:DNA polymerase-3 subunit alpha
MASLQLDDRTGRMEVAVFSDLYESCSDALNADKVLLIGGSLSFDEYRGGLSLRADRVFDIEQAREMFAERLSLRFDPQRIEDARNGPLSGVEQLRALLEPYRGGQCAVSLEYRRGDALGVLRFGESWRIRPAESLLKQLRELLGADAVKLIYGRMMFETGAPQMAFG